MARKRSKSVDGFLLPLQPDRKKARLTILQRCVICQNDIPDIPLRKGKQSSVSNLIKAAKYRQDDVFNRLSQDDIDSCYSKELLRHSSCYATYTSPHNIKHTSSPDAANAEHDTSQEAKKEKKTNRVSRSETPVTDWSKCFICKKKTYKKVTEMISVSTFEACQGIKKAATTKGDEEMLHVLRGVNDDLIAADAKYHKNCYALYVMNSKKVVHSSEAGNQSETPYDKAFHQLMTKDPAPSTLLELTTCTCKKSECQRNCSCANVGLSCTEACTCMADETCCNPHGIQWEEDDASDSDSDN